MRREAGSTLGAPVERVFRLAFGRPPHTGEKEAAVALAALQGLLSLSRALLNSNEFLYY